jgi:hypothetical protein
VIVDLIVMAHPRRAEQAIALSERLKAWLVWDELNNEWDTGSRAWRAATPDADWVCVIQDDAHPVPNFHRHLTAALEHAPRTAVSLYVGTGRPRTSRVTYAVHRAHKAGASWLECDALLWGVAIAMPREHIAPMLEWAQDQPQPYDQRISAWYRVRQQPVRHTWPSLVDHADGPTLVNSGRPAIPRHAHYAREPAHDWTGPVVRI